jgi:hypothetical protein
VQQIAAPTTSLEQTSARLDRVQRDRRLLEHGRGDIQIEGGTAMGVTSIRHVDNHTNKKIVVANRENPNNNFTVPADDGHEGEMWIPWCDDSGSFNSKHIEFRVEATGKTYYVWQSGDRVRYSEDGAWAAGGQAVPGDSFVDGDRRVVFSSSGEMLFRKKD